MAKVIIGGQMLSLVLALLVTPVFYEILDMFKNLGRRLGIRFSVESKPPHPGAAAAPGGLNRPHRSPEQDDAIGQEHESAGRFA